MPIPTRVPTVSSEKSMLHSSKGNKGLRKDDDCNTLFQVDNIAFILRESTILSEILPIYSFGDEVNDIAFWLAPVWFLKLYVRDCPKYISSWSKSKRVIWCLIELFLLTVANVNSKNFIWIVLANHKLEARVEQGKWKKKSIFIQMHIAV